MRGHELGGGQKPKTTLTISSLLPRHLPQELSGSCLHRMPLCPQPLLMPRRGALKAAIVTMSLEPASPTRSCCGAFCVPRFWHNGGLLIQKVRPDWQRATCQCPSRPGLSLALWAPTLQQETGQETPVPTILARILGCLLHLPHLESKRLDDGRVHSGTQCRPDAGLWDQDSLVPAQPW